MPIFKYSKLRMPLLPLFLYIIIILAIFFPLIIRPGQPVGNDWYFPVYRADLTRWYEQGLTIWSNKGPDFLGSRILINLMLPFEFVSIVINKIFNINGEIYLKGIMLATFFFGGISSYLLLLRLNKSKTGAFLGSLIFIFNPVTFNFLLMGWLYVLTSVFSFTAILLLYDNYLIKKRAVWLVLAGLLFGIFGILESQSIFHIPFLLFCFHLVSTKRLTWSNIKNGVINIILIGLIAIAINAHWILPTIFVPESIITRSLSNTDMKRFALRFSFINFIRGWGSVFNYQYEISYPEKLRFFSFLTPLIVGLSFLKIPNKKSIFFYFLFLYPFLLYLASQTIFPYIPMTNIIRDFNRSFPYLFLGVGYMLSRYYSINRYSRLISFITCFFVLLPFLAGYLFQARVNKVGVSDQAIDQRLRLYKFSEDITFFDQYLDNTPNAKALLLPTGGPIQIVKDKRFNYPWAAFYDYSPSYTKNIYNFQETGNIKYSTEIFIDSYNNVFQGNCEIKLDNWLDRMNRYGFTHLLIYKNQVMIENQGYSSTDIINCLNKSSNILVEKSTINYDLYKIVIKSNKYEGDLKIYKNIGYLDNQFDVRSHISVTDDNKDIAFINKKVLKPGDSSDEFIQISKEFPIDKKIYWGQQKDYTNPIDYWDPGWAWPQPSINPESLIYFLVSFKEKLIIFTNRSPLKQIDNLNWFASKRISEIDQYPSSEATQDSLIRDYVKLISKTIQLSNEVPNQNRNDEYWELMGKCQNYLYKSINILKNEGMLSPVREKELENYQLMLRNLITLNEGPNCVGQCFIINTEESTTYNLIIKSAELKNTTAQLTLFDISNQEQIFSKTINSKEEKLNKYIIENVTLIKNHKYQLEIKPQQTSNLISTEYYLNESTKEFRSIQDENTNESFEHTNNTSFLKISYPSYFSIDNWEPFKLYKLSFKYTSVSDPFTITVYEEGGMNSVLERNKIFSEMFVALPECPLNNENMCVSTVTRFFHSGGKAKRAYMTINPAESNLIPTATIYNFSLTPEPNIEIYAETNTALATKNNNIYHNETYYSRNTIVTSIKNIESPFILSLIKNYHPGWKLFYADESNWREINEKRHVVVNGIENGWYIDPKELGNKDSYLIKIEFEPETIFRNGLTISLLSYIVVVMYLIYNVFKHLITKKSLSELNNS